METILRSVQMETSQYQLGKTKLFIKDPASVWYNTDQCMLCYHRIF